MVGKPGGWCTRIDMAAASVGTRSQPSPRTASSAVVQEQMVTQSCPCVDRLARVAGRSDKRGRGATSRGMLAFSSCCRYLKAFGELGGRSLRGGRPDVGVDALRWQGLFSQLNISTLHGSFSVSRGPSVPARPSPRVYVEQCIVSNPQTCPGIPSAPRW